MFRHKGKSRTYTHNLRLASLLSFIAGLVNISGILAVQTLTTNVTGHFGYFAEELINERYFNSFVFLMYILFFLIGAFTSNFLIEFMARVRPRISHTIPITIEIVILIVVAFSGVLHTGGQFIACALLFAMGIQNSLVTKVSQFSVRTTHLTGLFTDLGIDLSQLFFYRQAEERKKLSRSIYLRFIIIIFFFAGCILGGFSFKFLGLKTLFLAAACLTVALGYDTIRYRYYILIRRRMRKTG